MNNRERVLATLNHEQPDKTPFNIGFTQKARAKMVEYTGDEDFDGDLHNCLTEFDTAIKGSWVEVEPDIWKDEFGVRWNRTIDKDIGNVCNLMVTPDNIDDFAFPDPDDPSRYEDFERRVQADPEGFFVGDIGFSLYERAWTLAGMENLLQYTILDPEFVHKLLDRITQHNLRIIENACRYEIDAMRFGDDWGMQTGVIMGAKAWREFIKPCIRQMYQLVRSKGKFVIIHSCGCVSELFPDLIECGLNVFNPFQPEVMDVFEMKSLYGDRLTFYGGISTQKTLPYGTVQQTKDEVRRLIDVVGKDGGYIAAPAHAIPGDAKPENVLAMIEVLDNQ